MHRFRKLHVQDPPRNQNDRYCEISKLDIFVVCHDRDHCQQPQEICCKLSMNMLQSISKVVCWQFEHYSYTVLSRHYYEF